MKYWPKIDDNCIFPVSHSALASVHQLPTCILILCTISVTVSLKKQLFSMGIDMSVYRRCTGILPKMRKAGREWFREIFLNH